MKLAEVAVIQKRVDALTTAINVLRSSDTELSEALATTPTPIETKAQRNFRNNSYSLKEKEAVQTLMLEYAQEHEWFSTGDIVRWLAREKGKSTSLPTVSRYIDELKFAKRGEAQKTQYSYTAKPEPVTP